MTFIHAIFIYSYMALPLYEKTVQHSKPLRAVVQKSKGGIASGNKAPLRPF